MIKVFKLVFIFAIITQNVLAQWQQQVNHTIKVFLNDRENTLTGSQQIQYTNNSPDTLNYIWLHLYANAYKNDKTLFTDFELANGRTAFYFSKDNQKGYINKLNFFDGTNKLKLEDHPQHQEMVKLYLANPLAPSAIVNIATDFFIKIPYCFNGNGHIGQHYQIIHWYAQPAVYNKNGWQLQPLTNQATAHDYGNFNAYITLPKNYKVAANANLRTEEEKEWLKSGTPKFADTLATKTLHFTAGNLNQLVWFASKTYRVNEETIKLIDNSSFSILRYAFGKEPSKNIDGYDIASIVWQNKTNFPKYPLKHLTIVQNLVDDNIGFAGLCLQQKNNPNIKNSANWFNITKQEITEQEKLAAKFSKFEKPIISSSFQNFNKEIEDKTLEKYTLLAARFRQVPFNDTAQLYQHFSALRKAAYIESNDSIMQAKATNPKKSIRFAFGYNFANEDKQHTIGILPVLGANAQDKLMFGALVHNYGFVPKPFQFAIAPLYATGTKQINGLANLQYGKYFNKQANIVANTYFAKFTGGSFTDKDGKRNPLTFTIANPSIQYEFAKKASKQTLSKKIKLSHFSISETQLRFVRDTGNSFVPSYPSAYRYVNQLSFSLADARVLYPYQATAMVEQGKNFAKLNLTANAYFNYNENSGLNVRFFAGKFFYLGNPNLLERFSTYQYHYNMTGPKGDEDYTYQNYFVGRQAFEGVASQQIMERDGFFKVRTDLLSDKVGRSDNWLIAANFVTDLPDQINILKALPVKIPLKFFVDIGTNAESWEKNAENGRFLYDAGVQMSFFRNALTVYVPLLYSKVYKDYFKSTIQDKTFQKNIAFSINIQALKNYSPFKGFSH
jgi:hypothetical protein